MPHTYTRSQVASIASKQEQSHDMVDMGLQSSELSDSLGLTTLEAQTSPGKVGCATCRTIPVTCTMQRELQPGKPVYVSLSQESIKPDSHQGATTLLLCQHTKTYHG